jgi:hypothetical protein
LELLSSREVAFVTRKWIGVSGGYLGDFSYRTHHEFYPDYCEIEDIDPYKLEGTTRMRFEHILKTEAPARQALILRGVLKKFPDPADKTREAEHRLRMQDLIARCEGGVPIGAVKPTTGRVVVEQALREVDDRLKAGAALAAVDRIHTAFAGFLAGVAADRQIDVGNDPPITKVFKLLRTTCPELGPQGRHADQIIKILNSLASVVDAVDPLRNHGTLAHANEHLLDAAEATLYINSVKTLMHYVNSKLYTARGAQQGVPDTSPEQNAIEEKWDDDIPF